MGYCTSGTYEKKLLIDRTDKTFKHVTVMDSIHCGNEYCMCVLMEKNTPDEESDTYKILGFKQKNYESGKQPCINGIGTEITETEKDTNTTSHNYKNVPELGDFYVYKKVRDYQTTEETFFTSLPIFDSNEKIANYVKTGDDSERVLFLNTKWTLYIDGKSNPLYKLTWECNGLKDIDTAYTDISIWVGTYNVFDNTFNDDDGTKFKNIDYNEHSVKFSYSDIEKLVPQRLAGHNPPSIRVQLAYSEFTKERVKNSTNMR